MARYSIEVRVCRQVVCTKEFTRMSSAELVPGDIFEVSEDGSNMPCDALLLSGTIIMNESMLTGESTPVVKQALSNSNDHFRLERLKGSLLYAGTKIVQKRSLEGHKVLAMVYSTAFNTEKGNLVRSILFPKESNFKFKNDSIKYIVIMAILSGLGFLIAFPFMVSHGIAMIDILFKAMDLLTTTVPPALPACLGIGISIALKRIKDRQIICINRDRVNVVGKVDTICFDKTGTLTEDSLDLHGFVPIKYKKGIFYFGKFLSNCQDMVNDSYNYVKSKMPDEAYKDKPLEMKASFIESISTCHCITRVGDKLVGDPVDIKMFESTKWILAENFDSQTGTTSNNLVSNWKLI